MPGVTVRAARQSDFVLLEPIFDSWHPGLVALDVHSEGWTVAELDGVVAGGLLARQFCAWDSGLVGYEHLTEDDMVPFAALMCVAQGKRGQGVGTALMLHWIHSAPAWAHVIMPDGSDDDASRSARNAFFERLGFQWMETAYEELEPWLMIRRSPSTDPEL